VPLNARAALPARRGSILALPHADEPLSSQSPIQLLKPPVGKVQTTTRLRLLSRWCAALGLLLLAAPPACRASRLAVVNLAWTATGNDDRSGQADHYELRYSTSSVSGDTLAWWESATEARSLPHPSAPGLQDRARVTGLRPKTTYYFILRAYDAAGNGSDFSNVASTTTGDGVLMAGPAPVHAYPNPSHDVVRFLIHVDGSAAQPVRLRVFDMTGRVVGEIADGVFPPGDNEVTWSGRTIWGDRVAPGCYESIGNVGSANARESIILLP